MKRLQLPLILLIIGILLCPMAHLLVSAVKDPVITEQDFNVSVTYTLQGETKVLETVYRCRFTGHGSALYPLDRYYEGSFAENDSRIFPVAEDGDRRLCLVIILSDALLMGDGEYDDHHYDPYLAIFDDEGYEYDDAEMLAPYGAEIVSWEYPESVENEFVFTRFAGLYSASMVVMLLVGLLTLGACLIFVKRDKTVPYTSLDIASIVTNAIAGLGAIPFITLVTWLMELYVSGTELIYRIDLCLPALTAFTLAASVSLRRKRFSKSALAISLVGPALFVLMLILEAVATY